MRNRDTNRERGRETETETEGKIEREREGDRQISENSRTAWSTELFQDKDTENIK